MPSDVILLEVAKPRDMAAFKSALQEAFAVAVVEELGALPDGSIPSSADIDSSIAAPNAIALHLVSNGRRVGGAVVCIDDRTNENSLDLFFISTGAEGQGLGYKAWSMIEQRFPDTQRWEVKTPYFEKRNIHFYVNKCGFKIVEFFNSRHPDESHPGPTGLPADGAMFRFEKLMSPAGRTRTTRRTHASDAEI